MLAGLCIDSAVLIHFVVIYSRITSSRAKWTGRWRRAHLEQHPLDALCTPLRTPHTASAHPS